MKFYCHTELDITGGSAFKAGQVYSGYQTDNGDYHIKDPNAYYHYCFTSVPDADGYSYKTWFSLEKLTYKDFDSMTKAELQAARNDLQKRLRSTLNPTKVIKLSNAEVTLQGGSLEGTYLHANSSLYVRGTNSSIGEISVNKLTHAENVLKRFFARHVGGFNLD